MRVIAGEFKGRRLKAPRGWDVRPTSDKVKGALFNIIGSRIDGARVIDLFAGTGNVGIEALSRGAGHVMFVENDPEVRALLAANLATCGISSTKSTLWKGRGVASLISHLKRQPSSYGLVFADPPYHRPETFRLLRPFLQGLALEPGGWLVIEHASHMASPTPTLPMRQLRQYPYGDTMLSVYTKAEAA